MMKSFMRWQLAAALFMSLAFLSVQAQSGAFTYQGRLTDNAQPPSGAYLLKFELYDAASEGTLIDALTDVPATVQNGVFTVELNFAAANAFNGAERFLQISVRRSAAEAYVTLTPRQKIASAPYAVRALTAENALQIDGTPAAQIIREGDARLTDSRLPMPGSGDYIQNRLNTPQTSTNFNISGTGTADVLSAVTQFNLGGQQILSNRGNGNLFIGVSTGTSANSAGQLNTYVGAFAGNSTTTAISNSFFGVDSGEKTTIGSNNSFFGATAGNKNTEGNWNSFFGRAAGQNNVTGGENSFFGGFAGINNTSGGNNAFFGYRAGIANKTGSSNTVLGGLANLTSDNLSFATAIGAGALVSTSNTIVLGRPTGEDTVVIPGGLNLAGGFATNAFRTFAGNTFVGLSNGSNNSTGDRNAFFGSYTGTMNTTGDDNSFFGRESGTRNTDGNGNSFFGSVAGFYNISGSRNTFIGSHAGTSFTTGTDNTALGFGAAVADNLSFATVIGAGASVETSNTIVLGRSLDTVQVPGILNAAVQYNLGGNRFLSAPAGNTFLGFSNGVNVTTGDRNAFFGSFAGTSNTTGGDNSFFGREAGKNNLSGSGNAFFGFAAGYQNVSGLLNTFIGDGAAVDFTSGTNNTALGSGTFIKNNISYATAIGADASVSTSNTIVLGRANGTDDVRVPGKLFVGNVTNGDRRNMQWDPDTGQLFQDTSSRRYKENIRPLETNFRLLLKAQPQTYTRPGFPGRWEIGFIAEEMDALGLKPLVEYDAQGRPDGVNYDKIPLYLTKIAAAQQTEIERLNTENTELKTRLDAQQRQLDALKQIICAQNKDAAVCKAQN